MEWSGVSVCGCRRVGWGVWFVELGGGSGVVVVYIFIAQHKSSPRQISPLHGFLLVHFSCLRVTTKNTHKGDVETFTNFE